MYLKEILVKYLNWIKLVKTKIIYFFYLHTYVGFWMTIRFARGVNIGLMAGWEKKKSFYTMPLAISSKYCGKVIPVQ